MSIQPVPAAVRRPPLARPGQRRSGIRIDPPNTLPKLALEPQPELPRGGWIDSADAALATPALAPLAAPAAPPARMSRKWMAMIFASVALHAAIAGVFLTRADDETAQIAGAQNAGLAMLGNAAEDQARAGDEAVLDTTSVTIVTMTAARPVETVAATAVVEPVASSVETVVAEVEVAQAAADERVEPLRETTIAAKPADLLPQVLATDTPEIVADDAAVAPPAPVEEVAAEAVEAVEAVVEAHDAPAVKPVERVVEARPAPRRKAEPARQPPAPRKVEQKTAQASGQPAMRAERTASAGSGGRNKTDAAKGVADGQASGTRAASDGKGKAGAAGNAAVTNYPGKVRAKLARAVGRISRGDRRGAERDVQIAFTVAANGSVGGVSVQRSSGSATLDQAAVQAVRRAAPFPPIPEGAGRSTWAFAFPLGLVR